MLIANIGKIDRESRQSRPSEKLGSRRFPLSQREEAVPLACVLALAFDARMASRLAIFVSSPVKTPGFRSNLATETV